MTLGSFFGTAFLLYFVGYNSMAIRSRKGRAKKISSAFETRMGREVNVRVLEVAVVVIAVVSALFGLVMIGLLLGLVGLPVL